MVWRSMPMTASGCLPPLADLQSTVEARDHFAALPQGSSEPNMLNAAHCTNDSFQS